MQLRGDLPPPAARPTCCAAPMPRHVAPPATLTRSRTQLWGDLPSEGMLGELGALMHGAALHVLRISLNWCGRLAHVRPPLAVLALAGSGTAQHGSEGASTSLDGSVGSPPGLPRAALKQRSATYLPSPRPSPSPAVSAPVHILSLHSSPRPSPAPSRPPIRFYPTPRHATPRSRRTRRGPTSTCKRCATTSTPCPTTTTSRTGADRQVVFIIVRCCRYCRRDHGHNKRECTAPPPPPPLPASTPGRAPRARPPPPSSFTTRTCTDVLGWRGPPGGRNGGGAQEDRSAGHLGLQWELSSTVNARGCASMGGQGRHNATEPFIARRLLSTVATGTTGTTGTHRW